MVFRFAVTGDIQIGHAHQKIQKEGLVASIITEKPLFLIHAGDVTDLGENDNCCNTAYYKFWNIFLRCGRAYTNEKSPKQLDEYVNNYAKPIESAGVPILECRGNHDDYASPQKPVRDYIMKKFGGLCYRRTYVSTGTDISTNGQVSVRGRPLHVICLDIYPTASNCKWLSAELAKIKGEPYVCFFHYPPTGMHSDWWQDSEKENFWRTIKNQPPMCIYVGHTHMSQMNTWNGIQVWDGSGSQFILAEWDGRQLVNVMMPNK